MTSPRILMLSDDSGGGRFFVGAVAGAGELRMSSPVDEVTSGSTASSIVSGSLERMSRCGHSSHLVNNGKDRSFSTVAFEGSPTGLAWQTQHGPQSSNRRLTCRARQRFRLPGQLIHCRSIDGMLCSHVLNSHSVRPLKKPT